jgi:FAD/FMN-containing dehydrogenase
MTAFTVVGKPIGEGTFGKVCRAVLRESRMPVVVKTLKAFVSENAKTQRGRKIRKRRNQLPT